MLKKVIAYQKLFSNSVPSINQNISNLFKTGLTFAFYAFALFMLTLLLDGAYYILIVFSIGSIWMINRNFNGDQPLFDMVPVSRRFIVFNIYLSAVFMVIMFLTLWLMCRIALVGIISGAVYIFSPESIGSGSFNRTAPDTLAILQGDLFMILMLISILFIGITIVFIRNKRYRNSAYIGLLAVVYGALSFLKSFMPASSVTDQVNFMESLSVMPQINNLLMGVGIATLLIVPLSIYVGYKLYMTPNSL
ncbi:MAG: hypothetical protein PHZ11_07600 [Desulfitobacteriaceae bacterium]|nr:hypothetical protein [Desulfitobacteriaceae bacterium]